jgi:hypothetical protein
MEPMKGYDPDSVFVEQRNKYKPLFRLERKGISVGCSTPIDLTPRNDNGSLILAKMDGYLIGDFGDNALYLCFQRFGGLVHESLLAGVGQRLSVRRL